MKDVCRSKSGGLDQGVQNSISLSKETKITVHHVGIVTGEVPGRQTVPRAEVVGAGLAVKEAALSTPKLWSDATVVVAGSSAEGERRDRQLLRTNGDCWASFFETYDPQVWPKVGGVKSHRSLQAVEDGLITMHQYVGNHLADVAADAAAIAAQPSNMLCQHVERWSGIAFMAAQRLCVIEVARWRIL